MVRNKAMSVALALSLGAGLCPSMAYVQAAYADEEAQTSAAQVSDVIAAGQGGTSEVPAAQEAAAQDEAAQEAGEQDESSTATSQDEDAVSSEEVQESSSSSDAIEEAAEEAASSEAAAEEELAEESIEAQDADAGAAVTLTFGNNGVTASSDSATGFKASGTELTINEPGTYVVTGSCSEGNVKVKKGTTGVTLVLRDLNLACSTTAPVAINKDNGDTTVRIEGSVVLADNEDAATEETNADFEGAALKVKSGSNLTISGTGTLTADGSACKNAIKGGAGVTIAIQPGVTIDARAANNGIASDGGLVVNGGTLNVTAGNDGLKSEPDEGDTVSAGTITINDGDITVVSTGDGIQATGDLTINGGAFDITANGGAKNGSTLTDDSDSCKGIKTDGKLTVAGGSFALDTADDAIHADGDVAVLGGDYTIASGDDAIHSDYVLTIGASEANGPAIDVTRSVEGLEGAIVNFKGGSAKVVSSDDGVNAANSDLGSYAFAINLTGGTLWVNAEGDGLDSNGAINVTGGVAEVFGSSGNVECAVDTIENTGTWTVNDGTILAVGNSGMAEVPSSGTYVLFGSAGMMGGMGGQPGGMNMGGQQPGGMPGQFGGQQGFAAGAGQPASANAAADQATAEEATEADQAQASPRGNGAAAGQAPGGMNMGGMAGQAGGSSIVKAGSAISIKDSSGNEVFASTGMKNANSTVFASPNLKTGETYTLYVDGTAAATSTAGTGSNAVQGAPAQPGSMQPGAQNAQTGNQNGQGGTMPTPPSQGGSVPAFPSQNGQNAGTPAMPGQDGATPPVFPGQNQNGSATAPSQSGPQGTQPTQNQGTGASENAAQPTSGQTAGKTAEQASSVWSRLQGANAYGTMEQIVNKGWASSDVVVIATFDGYWDALAASSLAGAYDAPVLLTSGTQLSAQTKALIQKLGATKAYIVGGPAAVSNVVAGQIADALSGSKSVERVSGSNAVQTAQAVAAKVGAKSDTCLIATSNGYWDALAAGPYAYAKQAPIFLAKADGTLDAQTLVAIQKGGYSKAVIVGGGAAVDASAEAALAKAGVKDVSRQAGANAYATSQRFATWAMKQGLSANQMGVATADGYWDALTGAALCGKNGSVLVLADAMNTTALDVAKANKSSIKQAYVFGGASAVGTQAWNAAVEAVK